MTININENTGEIITGASNGTTLEGTQFTFIKSRVAKQAVPPTANNDELDGYVPGSLWLDVNSGLAYMLMDASAGAAVWQALAFGGSGGLADPGADGIVVRTAPYTTTATEIKAGSAKLTVTDGDGVAGDPTIDLGAVGLNDIVDVVIAGPIASQFLTYNGTNWVNTTVAVGETNTASNVGTGVGVFAQKAGVDLQFHVLTPASNKASVVLVGNEINIDVVEANLTLDNIGGVLSITKGGTGQVTAGGALNALLPAQAGKTGQFLQTDGSSTSWAPVSGTNVYGHITDGTNTADASGDDTFMIRSADNKLTVAVTSNDITYGDNVLLTVNQGNIDHDSLTGYVGNEHVDHSAVSINAGTGLTGGGDLTTTRTLDVVDNTTTQKVNVSKNGTSVATRKQINLIEGSNVVLTVADDNVGDKVDVTITGSPTGLADPGADGIVIRTATNTTTAREIKAGSAKLSVSNGTGVAGDPTIDFGTVVLDDLSNVNTTAVSAGDTLLYNGSSWAKGGHNDLSGKQGGTTAEYYHVNAAEYALIQELDAISTGVVVKDLANSLVNRTITAGTGISISDGDGVGGNPTISTTITQYDDEKAQDAVGTILVDTSTIDFTYDDNAPTIKADVLPAGVDHDSLLNFVGNEHVDHTSVTLTAGTGLSGGGDISANRTFDLADTAVTPATYGSASEYVTFTVDQQGRLTAASEGNIAITQSQVTDLTTDLSNKQPLDSTLTALASYNTNGLITQTGGDTFTGRTITGTAGQITVTNGDGVAGNPLVAIDSTYAGQSTITTLGTVTTGVWNGTTIAINNGGTGATDKTNAFDALAPTTTKGDIIVNDGSDNVRLGAGTNGYVLTANSGATNGVEWAAPPIDTTKFQVQLFLEAGANNSYTFCQSSRFTFTVDAAYYDTAAGSITANVKINSTSVTGLSALSLTTTPGNTSASGANTVAVGDLVQVTFTSNSSATFVSLMLECTRT